MNDKIERIKKHLNENKIAYITGGSCLVIGVLVGVGFKSRPVPTQIINTVAPVIDVSPSIAPLINTSSAVNFGGHAHKFVKCAETNEIWETVTETAEAAGVSLSRMSRHLNNHLGPINDKHYSIIGVGTSA